MSAFTQSELDFYANPDADFSDFTDFNTFPEVEFSDEEFDDDDDECVREQPVSEYPSEITAIYDNIMRSRSPNNDTDADIEFMYFALSEIENAVLEHDLKLDHKLHFRDIIAPELIASAMHPRRMMARLNQCDDIERFFECC
jgi:hypothetical protein